MFDATQSGDTTRIDGTVTFRLPSSAVTGGIQDRGSVRMGGFGPAFRRAPAGVNVPSQQLDVVDAGRVRLGGFGPLFR